jgi:hypothetical protein
VRKFGGTTNVLLGVSQARRLKREIKSRKLRKTALERRAFGAFFFGQYFFRSNFNRFKTKDKVSVSWTALYFA